MPERQRLLELALKGLQVERAKIDEEIAQIKNQLNHQPAGAEREAAGMIPAASLKKRTMSAAARRKISLAMKRRYAEMRKATEK